MTRNTRESRVLPELARMRDLTEDVSTPFHTRAPRLPQGPPARFHRSYDFQSRSSDDGCRGGREIRLQDQIQRQDQNGVCTSPSTIRESSKASSPSSSSEYSCWLRALSCRGQYQQSPLKCPIESYRGPPLNICIIRWYGLIFNNKSRLLEGVLIRPQAYAKCFFKLFDQFAMRNRFKLCIVLVCKMVQGVLFYQFPLGWRN